MFIKRFESTKTPDINVLFKQDALLQMKFETIQNKASKISSLNKKGNA